MDTQQKRPDTRRRRSVEEGKRPGASQTPVRRKAAPKKAVRRRTSGKNTDRAKREAAARAAKIKAMKQDAQRKNRRVRKPRKPMEPVIYTQPRAFNRSRLMIQLISIMAVVMALILCLSIFFRVETITVSGANAYSAWAVRDASGIQEGDYLLTFSRARAVARIEAELPYVYSARIGIKLPNTVNIVIEEIDVVYAIESFDGLWWLMTSRGEIMEMTDAGDANSYTKVLGVQLMDPVKGETAVAYQPNLATSADPSEPTDATEETVPVLVTEKQKLDAALLILQSLELNEEVGTAASINVSELGRIELWYGTRFQVNLGDTNNMDYKIASMKAAIASFNEYEMAMLDCSFTTWPDKVAYTPFE